MKKFSIFIFSFLVFICSLYSEVIFDNDYGYTLDLPEGFILDSVTDNGKSILLTHPNISVNVVIKVQESSETDTYTILKSNLDKLKSEFEIDKLSWDNLLCSIGSFSMNLGQLYKGWSLCAPLSKDDFFITILSYCPEENFNLCQSFIISSLNSLSVSDSTAAKPGIFLEYAYPKEGKKDFQVTIGGKKISSSFDKVDSEANQFLIDLEFNVFTLYASHSLWKEAWQRYYRLVFRDTYGRFQTFSDDIFNALYRDCVKENKENPEIPMLTKLMSWVQNFSYKRDNKTASSSDLTPPVMAVLGTGNDCDSRSLILCSIMQHYGIDSVLLISKDYSHAMAAFDIPNAKGQTINTGHGEYIMCETTAKVTPGMISQNMADRTKWIIVE